MISSERALAIVYDAVDVVNRQLPASRRLRKSPDTVLVGIGGVLDSLGVVNFVLALEERAAREGAAVTLLQEDMLGEESPLRTVARVAQYLAERTA